MKDAQKNLVIFVRFVHTSLGRDAIIIIVKTPNTLIVFATPHKRNTFSKKRRLKSRLFYAEAQFPGLWKKCLVVQRAKIVYNKGINANG